MAIPHLQVQNSTLAWPPSTSGSGGGGAAPSAAPTARTTCPCSSALTWACSHRSSLTVGEIPPYRRQLRCRQDFLQQVVCRDALRSSASRHTTCFYFLSESEALAVQYKSIAPTESHHWLLDAFLWF